MKAKFVTAWNEKWYKVLEYEYRGHKYTVNTGLYTSLAAQHHTEQASIDALIEREEQRNKKFNRYEDTAEYGFNLFWDYVEG